MSKQMTPLRQCMIEDMTIRNMSPSTQKIYVRAAANFSIYHGCSPDKLTSEDVRDYRLHLIIWRRHLSAWPYPAMRARTLSISASDSNGGIPIWRQPWYCRASVSTSTASHIAFDSDGPIAIMP